ncbi:MAG: sulfurtransferase-like selenium metabolism protein YedF [Ezakiella sp.]|nr:sulfurtransferase-like selenium metabolism protein YedF [Ezakiella sp.]MDD7761291.1 sulfurtransferase-like selenium metabolism protein YedF [Bacillota bacterium]MDY3947162.1 sulfurtransferase-like selenium metabolism protein YedF [Ezakiella sp.]
MIDARGLLCPQPVILTKAELNKPEVNETSTFVDNEVAVSNLQKLAESIGAKSKVDAYDGYWDVTITKSDAAAANIAKQEKTVIAISRNFLGHDEELGKILIKSFIYTITEADHKPEEILFFNSGAKLVASDSEVLGDLKKLEEAGVKINTCGICLDYYNIKEDVQVGGITNMYAIYEAMATASHLINI